MVLLSCIRQHKIDVIFLMDSEADDLEVEEDDSKDDSDDSDTLEGNRKCSNGSASSLDWSIAMGSVLQHWSVSSSPASRMASISN
jgi:hypothetical protein